MAIPVIQSTVGPQYEIDTLDNVLTLTKPDGTVEGDLLIAQLAKDIGNVNVTSSGWTLLLKQIASGGHNSLHVLYKVATGAEPASYDFTFSSAAGSVIGGGIIRITGQNASSPIDGYASYGTPGSGSVTMDCPDYTTTTSDCLVLRLAEASDGSYIDDGSPANTTVLWANYSTIGDNLILCAGHQGQANAGATGVQTYTGLVNPENHATATIAIAPATGGTTAVTTNLKTLTVTPRTADVTPVSGTNITTNLATLTIDTKGALISPGQVNYGICIALKYLLGLHVGGQGATATPAPPAGGTVHVTTKLTTLSITPRSAQVTPSSVQHLLDVKSYDDVAVFPLEIGYPRGDAAYDGVDARTGDNPVAYARHKIQPYGKEYRIQAIAIGGKPPYKMTVSATGGLNVYTKEVMTPNAYNILNPNDPANDDYMKVIVKAADVASAGAGTYKITITVTDQDENTDTVNYDLVIDANGASVAAGNWLYYSEAAGDGGDGSMALPFNKVGDWDTGYGDKGVWILDGDVHPIANDGSTYQYNVTSDRPRTYASDQSGGIYMNQQAWMHFTGITDMYIGNLTRVGTDGTYYTAAGEAQAMLQSFGTIHRHQVQITKFDMYSRNYTSGNQNRAQWNNNSITTTKPHYFFLADIEITGPFGAMWHMFNPTYAGAERIKFIDGQADWLMDNVSASTYTPFYSKEAPVCVTYRYIDFVCPSMAQPGQRHIISIMAQPDETGIVIDNFDCRYNRLIIGSPYSATNNSEFINSGVLNKTYDYPPDYVDNIRVAKNSVSHNDYVINWNPEATALRTNINTASLALQGGVVDEADGLGAGYGAVDTDMIDETSGYVTMFDSNGYLTGNALDDWGTTHASGADIYYVPRPTETIYFEYGDAEMEGADPYNIGVANPEFANRDLAADTIAFGEGNYIEVIDDPSRVGKKCMKYNFEGRNGYMSRSGPTPLGAGVYDLTHTGADTAAATVNGATVTVTTEDHTSTPIAIGWRVWNTDNGFSLWEVVNLPTPTTVELQLKAEPIVAHTGAGPNTVDNKIYTNDFLRIDVALADLAPQQYNQADHAIAWLDDSSWTNKWTWGDSFYRSGYYLCYHGDDPAQRGHHTKLWYYRMTADNVVAFHEVHTPSDPDQQWGFSVPSENSPRKLGKGWLENKWYYLLTKVTLNSDAGTPDGKVEVWVREVGVDPMPTNDTSPDAVWENENILEPNTVSHRTISLAGNVQGPYDGLPRRGYILSKHHKLSNYFIPPKVDP